MQQAAVCDGGKLDTFSLGKLYEGVCSALLLTFGELVQM